MEHNEKMTYTKEQINTIGIATMGASHYVNLAFHQIREFWEKYFLMIENKAELISDLERGDDFVENQLLIVYEMINLAKIELDTFGNTNSPELQDFLLHTEEKRSIIKGGEN